MALRGVGAERKLNLNGNRSLKGCIRVKILNLPLGGLPVKHAEFKTLIMFVPHRKHITFPLRAQPVNATCRFVMMVY
jgi:hypothetical protein